jgi:phosphatidylglycerophosphate synthase
MGISPNAISLSSIVFAVVAGSFFGATRRIENEVLQRLLWIAGAVCVQLRLSANLLDGLVAVEGGKGTPVGQLYNEVPDRFADTAILLGAGYAMGSDPMLGALASIVAIFTAYSRAIGTSVGAGQIYIGPMAKPHRMALITATAAYYAVTPRVWHGNVLNGFSIIELAIGLIIIGGLITAARRFNRICRYLRSGKGT